MNARRPATSLTVRATRRRPAPAPVPQRRRALDVRLLIASGALDAQPVPSFWRGLLAWLLAPSPFTRSPWGASTQFAESTQQGVLP